MKKRTLALLLAGTISLSMLSTGALAAEGNLSLPDASATQAEENGDASEVFVEEYIPDPIGSISFANLNHRMHEGSMQILALQESIDMLEEIDYDDLKEDLRVSLNELAKAQWSIANSSGQMGQLMHPLVQAGVISEYEAYHAYNQLDNAYNQLDSAYSALRKQFDAIKDGDMQKDNADTIRQLKNLQNQIIMAGESTYIALTAMDIQKNGLERQLAALDRQLTELELRHELGHISSLTLHQAQAGRAALSSGLSTLRMNLDTYKGQLELLLGADITGNISLGALPKVTQEELNGMDLERDLETAKANSWDLYDATETIKEEKKTYNGHGGDYFYPEKQHDRSYMQARHSWYTAKYTYDNKVQSFELSLRNLYLKVQDYKQILDAAQTALAVEQDNYAATQLKQSQGTVSRNDLQEAEDKLQEAKEKVSGAENDLFSAYNTYRWAVDYGILN